jgi:hypothetical protein
MHRRDHKRAYTFFVSEKRICAQGKHGEGRGRDEEAGSTVPGRRKVCPLDRHRRAYASASADGHVNHFPLVGTAGTACTRCCPRNSPVGSSPACWCSSTTQKVRIAFFVLPAVAPTATRPHVSWQEKYEYTGSADQSHRKTRQAGTDDKRSKAAASAAVVVIQCLGRPTTSMLSLCPAPAATDDKYSLPQYETRAGWAF